jgi:hypothetical protein
LSSHGKNSHLEEQEQEEEERECACACARRKEKLLKSRAIHEYWITIDKFMKELHTEIRLLIGCDPGQDVST